jgi:uncharacterized protein (TIGR03437 family)
MKFAGFTLALAGIFAGNALGQTPTVGGLLNNYSYTLPGLPNYGIAQGSIFVIYGTNFSSSQIGLQSPPTTPLSGVTISVTVNGTATSPPLYYLYPTQIAAVLPSATPVGTGSITVTTSAGTSTAFPIQVVASAFGLLTSNNGSGPAQGYDANLDPNNQYTLFGFSAAANPGDILLLWGSGLGPVANDATGVAVSGTVTVYIGGIAVKPQYAGRSEFTGLDQINVQVPSGLSGCYVSVVVQTGNIVSNFATLPVTASGRTCVDADSPLTASVLDQLSQTGSLNMGLISVNQVTTPGITVEGVTVGGGTTDVGSASFEKITSAQIGAGAFAAVLGGYSSIGSCFVDFFNTTSTSSTSLPLAFQFTSLNAGPDVNIVGPDGTLAMPLQTLSGIDTYTTPAGTAAFIPSSGGTFTFNNGSGGGPDIGAFTTPQIQIAAPVTWSSATSSISTVTRSNGLTVSWTGGAAGTHVDITGISLEAVNGTTTNYLAGFFSCRAPTEAGTFTVPPAVLLSLPPSSTITEDGVTISTSILLLSNFAVPVNFTAPHLDVGLVEAGVENILFVAYK